MERLAKSAAEDRWNTFELDQPKRIWNLKVYNRDDIDGEITAWRTDRYYPIIIIGLLGGAGNESEINISNEARAQCKLIINAGYTVRLQSLALLHNYSGD